MTAPHGARARASGDWRGSQDADRRGGREHLTDSMAVTARATAARSSPMVSVYDGQTCIGFVFSRGKLGFEAFDSDEKSIGLFPTQRAAAASVMRSPA